MQSSKTRTRRPVTDRSYPPPPPVFGDAVCSTGDYPASWWDSDVAGETKTQQEQRWAKARTVCASCPIKDMCLEIAQADGMASGVWGGKTFTPTMKELAKSWRGTAG